MSEDNPRKRRRRKPQLLFESDGEIAWSAYIRWRDWCKITTYLMVEGGCLKIPTRTRADRGILNIEWMPSRFHRPRRTDARGIQPRYVVSVKPESPLAEVATRVRLERQGYSWEAEPEARFSRLPDY